jgi:hypothetical protein
LFQIDLNCILAIEFKCDAPGAVHMNRLARRIEAAQGMKIKARQVHTTRFGYDIEAVEPYLDSLVQPFVDPARRAVIEQFGQRFASKRSDH